MRWKANNQESTGELKMGKERRVKFRLEGRGKRGEFYERFSCVLWC